MRNLLSEYMTVAMTIFMGMIGIAIIIAVFYGGDTMGNLISSYIDGFVAH